MRDGAPGRVKYALGLMFVMATHMMFNTVMSLFFPDVYQTPLLQSVYYQVLFIGVSIWEYILIIFMYLGSGLFHKLALFSLFWALALTVANLLVGGTFGVDFWLHITLAAIVFVMLITKPSREFYHNWSLGERPSMTV